MATGAQEHIDATTAAALIETAWSKQAIIAREKKLVFTPNANRVFENDATVGDTINVPTRSHLSVQTKSRAANAATVYETITETNTAITITVWEYSGIAIETATKRQVNRDMLEWYAPEQGYALALSVDTALAALVSTGTQNVGVLTIENTYDETLRARQYIDDANAPLEDRYACVAPAAEVGFLKIPQFIHSDYSQLNGGNATGMSAREKAYFGSWMGIPFFKSTNVAGSNAAGHENFMAHKDGLALVMQMKASTHQMFDIDYLALKVVVEQLYGVKKMRDDHIVDVKGA